MRSLSFGGFLAAPLWESWSVKRWLWYCEVIQLEPKRNVNCILLCMKIVFSVALLVFHILIIFGKVKNIFLFRHRLYFVGCKYCFAPLLVPPFFSSLLRARRGKYFSLLQESNSARYANGALLLKEILFNLPPNSYIFFPYFDDHNKGILWRETSDNKIIRVAKLHKEWLNETRERLCLLVSWFVYLFLLILPEHQPNFSPK